MPGTSETLKRKSSATQDFVARKNLRANVHSFVPKPDEADLRVPGKLTVEGLRIAMELDIAQFKEMTGLLRGLAKYTLNIDATLTSQDEDEFQKFKAEACERQPLFYTKYEDAWPIEVYMELYLYNRAATAGSRCRSANLNARSASEQLIPSVDRHESPSSTCISRPSNEAKLCQLGKATMDQLRMAMGFSRPEFKKLRNSLMGLAHKHLDTDVTFARQPLAKWQAFEQDALKAESLLSTQFEGAWPLRVYMKRYLAKRNSRPRNDSQRPDQISDEGSSSKVVTPQPSEARSECDGNRENTSSPLPSIVSDYSLSNITSSGDNTKVLLEEHAPSASMPPPDNSAAVVQFLRSVDPTLEHLFDLFVTLGVRDGQTLASFQRLSKENRNSLLRGKLNDLQLLGLDIYFNDA